MRTAQAIWYMDGELCECCGWLLGYFGECTNPACLSWESWQPFGEEGVEEGDDPFTGMGDYDERAYLMGEYDI